MSGDSRRDGLHESLPEAVKTQLASLGCPLDATTHIQALSRGLSNQNYHLSNAGKQLVLRVNSQASSQISARDHEVANWRLAQRQGIAPELIYVAPDNRFYLSRFIDTEEDWSRLMTANPAHPLQDEAVTRHDAEVLLLELLRGLSRLPVPENPISVSEQWRRYFHRLDSIAEGCRTPASYSDRWQQRWLELKAHRARVDAVLAELDACELAPQYSHRDLNPHNLLMSQGRLWCIDYEYACSSHPLVDLASVLATHSLSTEQRHKLILGYLEGHPKLNHKAQAAIPAALALYWYFAACWALLMASQGGTEAGESAPDTSLPHSVSDYLQCFDDFMVLFA